MTALDAIAAQIEGQRQPPVDQWKPKQLGAIDISIDANGAWFHEGDQIKRPELVRLFASILWFEEGRHYLVTPAQKLAIQVHDVPFVIQSAELIEAHWIVTTNTQESLIVSDQHPVTLRPYLGQQLPYVNVRYDLWARVSRAVYFQWVTQALEQAELTPPTLQSGDYTMTLGSVH